ncbi:MAG: DUF2029 domain-containing protein [Thermoflexales bacterium]|nr:DUF2029 domain-containing protein [Thermoflexales bacterium]
MGKPFQNLHSDEWLRLAGFALGIFYVILTIWTALHVNLFTVLGGDFRALFASARIAVTSGFSQVYNLAVQRETQAALMAPYATAEVETIPTPFLPFFILPFTLFLPLGLSGGFILWTILNIGALALYLLQLVGKKDRLFPGLAFLSLPVFLTLLLGQVNIWLLICVGEFLRAWEQGKRFYGGLWLGGLLMKPQTLILLIPVLFLKRRWDILAGFAVAALGIIGISLALARPAGITPWWGLLTRYTGQLSATDPQAMGNFRMLGWLLSLLVSPRLAWSIAIGLSVAIASLAFWASLRRRGPEDETTSLLSLLAATCAVAWHSHIHMAAILIPPMLRQVASGQMPRSLLALWSLLPPAIYFLAIATMALLTARGGQPLPLPGFTYPALAILGLHIYFVIWAVPKTN